MRRIGGIGRAKEALAPVCEFAGWLGRDMSSLWGLNIKVQENNRDIIAHNRDKQKKLCP